MEINRREVDLSEVQDTHRTLDSELAGQKP